ncbi:MAG: crossover junction endodeoxyribonuclease RuvC [Clostridia bacterium]|nr:crossover junction endodeoxyribonuclease RuvC [Clostridia bacterium]
MTILGIDPGLGITGYGAIEKLNNGDLIPIDYGVVETPVGEAFPQRLLLLEKGINTVLEKFKPDEIAVEELFFVKNITTGIPVAHARGVTLLTCLKYCPKLFEYTPGQVKQALTGYGNADKGQIIRVVTSVLRLKNKPRPDDAADGLAVAVCHANTSRFSGEFGIK